MNETLRTGDDLYPDGAIRFYEGDDPEGFAAEMLQLYGIDVTAPSPPGWGQRTNWDGSRSFFIRSGLVEEIYSSERWVLGS